MDKRKFSEGMAILCEQFEREATDLLLKGYWMVLEKMTDDEFEKAIMEVLTTKKFHKLPLPAEILEAAYGKSEDHAQLALNKIEKAIERHGNGNQDTVIFDDPYIHAAIQNLGGWIAVSTIYWTDEWPFFRKDVLRTYGALCRTPLDRLEVPEKLLGYHDLLNAEKQIKRDIAPKLIGDSAHVAPN